MLHATPTERCGGSDSTRAGRQGHASTTHRWLFGSLRLPSSERVNSEYEMLRPATRTHVTRLRHKRTLFAAQTKPRARRLVRALAVVHRPRAQRLTRSHDGAHHEKLLD